MQRKTLFERMSDVARGGKTPPPIPNPRVRHGPGRDNSGDAVQVTKPAPKQ